MRHTMKSVIFIKLLVSYILVLFIPIALFSFVSVKANRILEGNAVQFNMNMLEQSQKMLVSRIEDIQKTVMQISGNQELTRYAFDMESGREPNYYDIWQSISTLNSYTATNEYIAQAFIVLRKNKTIISTSSFIDASKYYGRSIKFGNINEEQFNSTFVDQYHQGDYFRLKVSDDKIKDADVIAFVKSFPDNVTDGFYGNIIILISNSKINELMKFGGENTSFILDKDLKLLTATTGEMPPIDLSKVDFSKASSNFETKIQGKSMYISYISSIETGFKHITIFPTQQVMSQALYIKNILFIVTFLSLSFGMLCSIFWVRNNTRPIYNIIGQLHEWLGMEGSSRNEYVMIQSAVNGLIRSNRNLQDLTQSQRNAIRENFFKILMVGGIDDNLEAQRITRQLNIEINGGNYQVVLIKTDTFDKTFNEEMLVRLKLFMDYCKEKLSEYLSRNSYAYQIDELTLMVLLHFSEAEAPAVSQSVETLCRKIQGDMDSFSGLGLSIGIGTAYRDMMNINCSYKEARTATECLQTPMTGVLRYEQITGENMLYSYSPEDQQHLLDFVKLGNLKQLEKTISEIFAENFTTRKIKFEMVEQLFYEMKGTLMKAVIFTNDGQAKEKIRGLKLHTNDITGSFNELKALLLKIAETICTKKTSHTEKIVEKVKEYLESNYSNNGINLASAASTFGITDVYLSTIFKAHTGENFNLYFEGIRLKAARRLLTDSEIPVYNIGLQVGYSSSESFRRAFKRKEGILPSEYRTLQKTQSNGTELFGKDG